MTNRINSKQKGNRGERQIANILKEHGFPKARRGVQYSGGPDSPDVIGIEGYHIEVKYVEKLNLEKAMEQSINDAGENEKPIVIHRRNRTPWKVTLLLEDFLEIIK